MATKSCTTQEGLPFEIHATADHLFDLVYLQEENSFLSDTVALNITPAELNDPNKLTNEKLIALIGLQMALAQNHVISAGEPKMFAAPNVKIEALLNALDASDFVLYLQDHEERPPIDCLYDLEGDSTVPIPDELQYNVLIGRNVVLGNLPDGGLALGFISIPDEEGEGVDEDVDEDVDEEDIAEVIPAEILEDPTVSIQMLNFKIPESLPSAKSFVDLNSQNMQQAIVEALESLAQNKDVSLPSALLTLKTQAQEQYVQAEAIQQKLYPNYSVESVDAASRKKVVELLAEINPSVFSGTSFIEHILEEYITPVNSFLDESQVIINELTPHIDTIAEEFIKYVADYNYVRDSLNEILSSLLSFFSLSPAQYEKFKINPETNGSASEAISFHALVEGLANAEELKAQYQNAFALLHHTALRSNGLPIVAVGRFVIQGVFVLGLGVLAFESLAALVYKRLADHTSIKLAALRAECEIETDPVKKAECEEAIKVLESELEVYTELAKGGPLSLQYILNALITAASEITRLLGWILIGGVGIYGATKLYPHVRGMFKS